MNTIPQNYPLFAAMIYMAADADVPWKERTCQHCATSEDVSVDRVVAWAYVDEDGTLPEPITVEHGKLRGFKFTVHGTEAEARMFAGTTLKNIEAYWELHAACDGRCVVPRDAVSRFDEEVRARTRAIHAKVRTF